MPQFETSLTLPRPPEDLFDFLARPANIVKISPQGIGLTFLSAPEIVEAGSRIEFKVQGWGQVQQMIHEIIAFDRPHQFIEKQVKGPFKHWIHEHHFATNADGHTVVTDQIEFEPPGGLIGLLITKTKILDHLEDAFYHRHAQLRKLLDNA